MDAKRVLRDGRVQLEINGEIVPPVAFMTYKPDAERFARFRSAGVRIFSACMYLTDHGINDFSGLGPMLPHFWRGMNEYDFSPVDTLLAQIAPTGKEAYIMPRLYIDAPRWWEEAHPDELCQDNRGARQRQSFPSEIWRRDTMEAIRALLAHIAASPWKDAVIGFNIAAGSTEEWTYHHFSDQEFRLDFSEPNRRAFMGWLQRKYGSIDGLNAAWHREYGSFFEIRFPDLPRRLMALNGVLRDPDREADVIDFWQYTSWQMADTILYFARGIKQASKNTLLTGSFYGYMNLARPEKGHYAMQMLLEAPELDFLSTTHGRGGPGDGWPFATAVDSLRLHGKLFFSEGDIRTCCSTKLSDQLPHANPNNSYYSGSAWKPLPGMELSLSALRKASLRCLTGQSAIWWFDMFGGWFDAPEMMAHFEQFGHWMSRQTAGPLQAEIAVILDEDGYSCLARSGMPGRAVFEDQRNALDRMGAPYHIYLAKDLAREDFPVGQYRLYILLLAVRPAEPVRRAIETKLKSGGRTLLWVGFSDMSSGGALTDSALSYDPMQPAMQGEYRRDNGAVQMFPAAPAFCPRFADPGGAYPVARFCGSMEPCVLLRSGADYTSLVSLLPSLPENLLQDVALWSNVHLYSLTADIVFAGGCYTGLHAREAGEKRIYFPLRVKRVTDAVTGEEMPLFDGAYMDFIMEQYETRVFRIEL